MRIGFGFFLSALRYGLPRLSALLAEGGDALSAEDGTPFSREQ